MKRYNHHGAATTVEHPEGMWVLWEDVDRLEAKHEELEKANAKLREFVEDFLHAKECGREDEEWLYDAAWDLRHNDEIFKTEGEEE